MLLLLLLSRQEDRMVRSHVYVPSKLLLLPNHAREPFPVIPNKQQGAQ
jgi:hypothetical protein